MSEAKILILSHNTQENIISVLNKGSVITWVKRYDNIGKSIDICDNNASMADTTQGGIWGNFSDISNFQPNQVAIDLKTLVKIKDVSVYLTGVSMPGVTDDGVGFPQNFGIWWRS